tara:strand:+ start:542 stop:1033 length:492 start_codon:yes stop_codon:yes gene_type:complete
MSHADILFQYYTTTANTTTTEAELAFQADQHGVTMIYSLFAASSGGSNNTYRVHHCGPDEEPDPSNCILYARSTSSSSLPNAMQNTKIILNPADRIFCQLHSGTAITITAYGLRPSQSTESPADGYINNVAIPAHADNAQTPPSTFNSGSQAMRFMDTFGHKY